LVDGQHCPLVLLIVCQYCTDQQPTVPEDNTDKQPTVPEDNTDKQSTVPEENTDQQRLLFVSIVLWYCLLLVSIFL
jgi:hypothetical protein